MLVNALSGFGVGGDIILLIDSETTDYDVLAAAGNPTSAVSITINISSGVIVGGVSGTAIKADALPAGSSLRIINNGTIVGKSGAQGAVGTGTPYGDGTSGGNGGTGGDAIAANCYVTIDNTNGYIYAGGGGGSGGRGGTQAGGIGGYGRGYAYSTVVNPGVDCRGGTCASNGIYCAGNSATTAPSFAANGVPGNGGGGYCGGTGGSGGDYGQTGGVGGANQIGYANGGTGGAGGYAVRITGYGVLWLGGNNGTQVKGTVG